MFIFLGAVSMCGYQTSLLLNRYFDTYYFSYPVKVTTRTVDNDVPFPMLMFCTMNPLEPHQLKRIAKRFKTSNIADYITNVSTREVDYYVDWILYNAARYTHADMKYKHDQVIKQQMTEIHSRSYTFNNRETTDDFLSNDKDILVVTSTF